jgi:hypothetical protein
VLAQNRNNLAVVGLALQTFRRDNLRVYSTGSGAFNSRGAFAIADDYGNFRAGNAAGRNAIGQSLKVRSPPA